MYLYRSIIQGTIRMASAGQIGKLANWQMQFGAIIILLFFIIAYY